MWGFCFRFKAVLNAIISCTPIAPNNPISKHNRVRQLRMKGALYIPRTKADGAARQIATRLDVVEVAVGRMPHAKIWVPVGLERWGSGLDTTGNVGRCDTQMNDDDFSISWGTCYIVRTPEARLSEAKMRQIRIAVGPERTASSQRKASRCRVRPCPGCRSSGSRRQ